MAGSLFFSNIISGSVLPICQVQAQWRDYRPGYGGGMMGWGFGGSFGLIGMLLFWVLIILGIVYFIKLIAGSKQSKDRDTAIDIVKKRYARGEITREEFEKLKKDLEET